MVEVIVLIFSKEIQEKWHGRFSTEGNTIRVLKPMSPKNVPRGHRSSKGPLLELHFKTSWPRGIKNQRFARLKENKPFGKTPIIILTIYYSNFFKALFGRFHSFVMIFRLVSAKSKIELKFESNLFFFKSLISVFQHDILIFEICISLYLFKKEFFTHAVLADLNLILQTICFHIFFLFIIFQSR